LLKYLFVISFLVCSFLSSGQSELYDEPVIIYNKQLFGGLHFHSNGYGGTFTLGRYKTAHKVFLLSADVLYMKHEKEIKSYNPVYDDTKSYVYGKKNNFYVLRLGAGQKKILTNKLRKSGVQVGYSYSIGSSIGITKPIYLEIGYPSIPYEYLAIEKYDPDKHYFDDIYGRASGLNGLNELRFYPGVFAKFAFNFEYSNEKDRLKGLEVGAVMDGYFTDVPIMAEEIGADNRKIFFNVFLNLFIGKKYIQR
jgi:hypothetical protein